MLVQVNPKDKMIQRQHVRKESGIRVYVEGFRVLPYGDQGNDWLALDSDYTRRSTIQYANELEAIFASMQQDTKWSSLPLPNRSYFGAVFVTQEDAGDLTPLINREGFLPNDAFYRLRHIVRIGIDLFTRVRASVEYRERTDARSNRRISEPVRGSIVLSTLSEARTAANKIRLALSTSNAKEAQNAITELSTKLEALQESCGDFVSEADLLRVTASVGTQMAEFVHEVQSLLGTAEAVTKHSIA